MVGDQDDLGAKIEAQGDIVRKLKAEKADKAKVKSPTWRNSVAYSFYCPQSFSGGGLYLKVKWLLWSVYDGLLWSMKIGLLWIGKNGLLWYMGHTCQFWVLW